MFEVVENETLFGKSGVGMSAWIPENLADVLHVLPQFLPSDSDTLRQIRLDSFLPYPFQIVYSLNIV